MHVVAWTQCWLRANGRGHTSGSLLSSLEPSPCRSNTMDIAIGFPRPGIGSRIGRSMTDISTKPSELGAEVRAGDRTAPTAAPSSAQQPVAPGRDGGFGSPGSHKTPRWREMDSNHRYRKKRTLFGCPRSVPQFAFRNKNRLFRAGTEGSNPSPSGGESGRNRCAGKRTRAETWDLAGLAWRSADGCGPARGSARPLPFRKNDMLTGEPAGRRRRKQ